jgi:hypothetical protein
MNIHNRISIKIVNILDFIYYKNLKKLYNNNLGSLFQNSKFPIINPEYFIYLKYYFIYTFFHYITKNSFMNYSLSLHLFYISDLIYDNLIIKYNYNPINNTIFLKDTCNLLFLYMFFLKIIFLHIWLYKKIILLSSIYIFYFLININDIYSKRMKSIEEKTEFKHPLKLLLITPNKNTIQKIINNTNIFTYSNFILFINLFIYMFI